MAVDREDRRGALGAPALETREAVGRVPHQGQVVGDRSGVHAELGHDPGLVEDLALATVELDHPLAADALPQVLVRRADHHLLDAIVGRGHLGRRAERVVGLVLDHGPGGDTHRHQRVLEDRGLVQELRRHALARLVARPQVVAEALDDVVRRHADVGGALLQELQRRGEHTDGGPVRPGILVPGGLPEVLPEQLVGAVDQVDLHPPRLSGPAASRRRDQLEASQG